MNRCSATNGNTIEGAFPKAPGCSAWLKEEVAELSPFEYPTVLEKPWLPAKFSPYFNLNSSGYVHLMVNHSENFVDPYTGAHTNTIEGVWSQVKRKLKAMNWTHSDKLPSYLDEFNWRKVYPR